MTIPQALVPRNRGIHWRATTDMAIALFFLGYWILPSTFGAAFGQGPALLMLGELLNVPAGFLALFVLSAMRGRGLARTIAAASLSAIYLGMMTAFLLAAGESWWDIVFAGLAFGRCAYQQVISQGAGAAAARERRRWSLSAPLLLALLVVTTLVPLPRFHAAEQTHATARGVWIEQPERLGALGAFHFFALWMLGRQRSTVAKP